MNAHMRKGRAYIFILPALVGIAFAILAVNAYNVYISFTNWGPGHDPHFEFVGLQQYGDIFKGGFASYFFSVFLWTLLFAGLSVGIAFSFGLFLAILLNNPRLKSRNLYRVLLILPWAIPTTMSLLAWRGIVGTSWSLIPGGFGDVWSARLIVVLVNVWTAFPFMMCASLGALQSIPPDVYEAAAIDGASRWKKFRNITLPLLRSAMVPVLISTFAFHFNNFTAIQMVSEGEPVLGADPIMPRGSDILITYSYRLAFGGGKYYALAAAFSVILFLILVALTFANFKITGAFKEVAR